MLYGLNYYLDCTMSLTLLIKNDKKKKHSNHIHGPLMFKSWCQKSSRFIPFCARKWQGKTHLGTCGDKKPKQSWEKCCTRPQGAPTRTLGARGEICHCRHCQRQCKFFASGVNFPIFTQFYNQNCWNSVKLRVQNFWPKIGRCKFFDKYHVCWEPAAPVSS